MIQYNIDALNFRTRFLCDTLADQGYKVVIPDFYRGQAWDDSPIEPGPVGKFVSQFPPDSVSCPFIEFNCPIISQGCINLACSLNMDC